MSGEIYYCLLNIWYQIFHNFRTYEWDYDTYRFPQYILKARRLCGSRACGGGNYCQPVEENMHVLYRTSRCQRGFWVYELRTIKVARSFTCAALATGLRVSLLG